MIRCNRETKEWEAIESDHDHSQHEYKSIKAIKAKLTCKGTLSGIHQTFL